jgi:hypothetical protein
MIIASSSLRVCPRPRLLAFAGGSASAVALRQPLTCVGYRTDWYSPSSQMET